MASKKTKKLVGEICLYGNHKIGAGWLATTADGRMFGDGEPREGRSMTEAVWMAASTLREAGVGAGLVRIYAAGGARMADADIDHPPYFGCLEWKPATVAEISCEAIMAAAEQG